jgi:hypothetical protein
MHGSGQHGGARLNARPLVPPPPAYLPLPHKPHTAKMGRTKRKGHAKSEGHSHHGTAALPSAEVLCRPVHHLCVLAALCRWAARPCWSRGARKMQCMMPHGDRPLPTRTSGFGSLKHPLVSRGMFKRLLTIHTAQRGHFLKPCVEDGNGERTLAPHRAQRN